MTAKNVRINNTLRAVLWAALLASYAQQIQAHEYWLDSLKPTWVTGDTLRLDIRNGENFFGKSLPLNPRSLAVAGLITPKQRLPLRGRAGNLPAIKFPLEESGLHLVVVETTARQVTYQHMKEFEEFLKEHDWQSVKTQHLESDRLDAEIVETYKRYAKALVTVREAGNLTLPPHPPEAALSAQGLLFEIVALDSPEDVNMLSIQVLHEGKPVANRQVELFHRNKFGQLNRNKDQTDSKGIATINIQEPGEYMLNSVWIEKSLKPNSNWQSLWASLTFDKL